MRNMLDVINKIPTGPTFFAIGTGTLVLLLINLGVASIMEEETLLEQCNWNIKSENTIVVTCEEGEETFVEAVSETNAKQVFYQLSLGNTDPICTIEYGEYIGSENAKCVFLEVTNE